MGKRQATFGKLQRERDKKAKAALKRERREERAAGGGANDEDSPPAKEHDEAATLAALAALHRSFDDGAMSIDEFEEQRDTLTSRLRVD